MATLFFKIWPLPQMARLFNFQNLPKGIIFAHVSSQFCQILNKSSKTPKWVYFAKSGHTAWYIHPTLAGCLFNYLVSFVVKFAINKKQQQQKVSSPSRNKKLVCLVPLTAGDKFPHKNLPKVSRIDKNSELWYMLITIDRGVKLYLTANFP